MSSHTTYGNLAGGSGPIVIDKRPSYDTTPCIACHFEAHPTSGKEGSGADLGMGVGTIPAHTCSKPKPFTATPLGDYIVVRRIPEPEGIIIEPDVAKDKPVECEVIAIPQNIKRIIVAKEWIDDPTGYFGSQSVDITKPILSVGDKVLIRRYSGTEVKVDGQEVTLILIQDVLLKL